MSASQYRRELEQKRKQRFEAEKKVGMFRSEESKKRADADKARLAASKTKSLSTFNSKMREVERAMKAAEKAGKDASQWQSRVTQYSKDEIGLLDKLGKAERTESEAIERKRKRDLQQTDAKARAERMRTDSRIAHTEAVLSAALREFPKPKSEKLRVLLLGASSDGELRVGREQTRIRKAVEAALHRDRIEIDARPSATTEDLLDGITKFRPHIVHFSGHSNNEVIVFEQDLDQLHSEGLTVSANAFAHAIQATDTPPLLVLMNSCNSASQANNLVQNVVPFAIGMSDSIGDTDAIFYAAQFYASVANGQSIYSAHLAGQVAMELAGYESSEFPVLASAADSDATTTILVKDK